EQKYIGLVLSKRLEDELHDKIYSFLQEKNGDQHPEADPWIARVTQVCRTDMGGSKVMLQKQWTSILSARLTCGFPTERLYFNRLLDIFVLHADNWRESKVYGLFSSRWNSTAVCIYSMEDIDRVFTTSKIKGYSGTIPTPRPGTCVRDSTTLSKEVLDIIKDNPEMEDWVKPIDKTAPFMVSHKHYRKIQVDRVMGQNNTSHTVLLLSAGEYYNGVVHEVLQVNGRPFIIEEIQPFKEKTHIQSMILNPTTKKLYVGSVNEVVQIDLQSCKHYGKTCQDCVLAQNPYCGWNGSECTSATEWTIQDVNNGQHTVCQQSSILARSSVQEESLSPSYYLSCPVLSNNAQYFWQHKGSTIECQLVNGECVYLMKEKTKDKAGEYICRALEKGYEKQVVQYSVKFTNRATALHSSSAVLASILPFAALYF
ncbi:SEM7A protein, partial [Amia calva]|nr:SEM7A protein [Amia calva]